MLGGFIPSAKQDNNFLAGVLVIKSVTWAVVNTQFGNTTQKTAVARILFGKPFNTLDNIIASAAVTQISDPLDEFISPPYILHISSVGYNIQIVKNKTIMGVKKRKDKMATQRSRRKFFAFLLLLVMTFIISAGCVNKLETSASTAAFTSIHDIPGVTGEEMKAVEELRTRYGSFTFSAVESTEAFYDKDGEIRGFAALFCGWLTEIFGIPLIPKIYEWGDLYPAPKADFSGELTATEERKTNLGFLFTDSIAERSLKYFRIAGGRPLSEITRTRPLRLAFLGGSTTSRAAIAKLEETSVPYQAFYVNDYVSAYNMMHNGEIDAFIAEAVGEASFDKMGNVVGKEEDLSQRRRGTEEFYHEQTRTKRTGDSPILWKK